MIMSYFPSEDITVVSIVLSHSEIMWPEFKLATINIANTKRA